MQKLYDIAGLSNTNSVLGRAIMIAIEAHSDQYDKANKPYINHPFEVAAYADDMDSRIVAILHDVLEDSEFTEYHLRDAKIPTHCIDAIRCLTKPKSRKRSKEPHLYLDRYLEAVSKNPLAAKVKLMDYVANTNFDRLMLLNINLREQLMYKYYRQAYQLCNKMLLARNEVEPWEWYNAGSGVARILVPSNYSNYTMNMKKFLVPNPIDYPDYILLKQTEFDWGYLTRVLYSDSGKEKANASPYNISYSKYTVRNLIESVLSEQSYAYIQVPALVLNDINWARKEGYKIYRVKKYPVSAFSMGCVDVIIYKEADGVPMIVEHFQKEKAKKQFRKEEALKLFRKQQEKEAK